VLLWGAKDLFFFVSHYGSSSSGGSSRSYGTGSTTFLTTTTAAFCSTRFGALATRVGLVEVDQFDHSHFGSITFPETGLDDAEVTARTIGNLRCNGTKKLFDGFFVLQVAEHHPLGVRRAVFRLRKDRIYKQAQGLCFGQGRVDPLVFDQGDRQVLQQGFAMADFTTEVVKFLTVTHG